MSMTKESFVAFRQTHVSVAPFSLPIFPTAVPYSTTDRDHAQNQSAKIDAMP
jgi:hypothetical protein